MINTKESGLSFLELMMTLLLMSIISLVLYQSLDIGMAIWEKGEKQLNLSQQLNKSIRPLEEQLRQAKKITYLSTNDIDQGAIQYLDTNNTLITVFHNTEDNQERFGDNDSSTHNIVVLYTIDAVTSNVEVVLAAVSTFNITSYSENPELFQSVTPNNTTLPILYEEINSIKFSIGMSLNGTHLHHVKMIHFSRDPTGVTGNIHYGSTNASTTLLPFGASDLHNGFVTSNTSIISDDPTQISDHPDGIKIVTSSYTIKIAHSGRYFPTIQNAIDAAVSGNTVLVAQGTYNESIQLKEGVQLLGGYHKTTWERNIHAYQSKIIAIGGGISNATVLLESNSAIDGFLIDGNNFLYGIESQGKSNITIQQNAIINSEIGLQIANSSGNIINNAVTSNSTSVILSNNSQNMTFYRNRFYTLNLGKVSNLLFLNSSNITFRNNIVNGGQALAYVEGSSISFINNVLVNSEGIVLSSRNESNNAITLMNNIIIGNKFGIVGLPADITMDYNYLAQNRFGHGIDALFASGTNTIDNTNTAPMGGPSDPIFDNNTTFFLKDTSLCIDTGNPNGDFNDTYTDTTGKGALRNDMGAYGGPEAGRVGQGETSTITTDTVSIQSVVDQSFPGDYILFKNGTHELTALTLRKGLHLSGESIENTILNRQGGAFLIDIENQNTLENLTLNGAGGRAVQALNRSNIALNRLLFLNSAPAIVFSGSIATLTNSTFDANTGAIAIDQAAANIIANNNIFASDTDIAISVDSGTVIGDSNVFFANATDTSGTLSLANTINQDPQFRDLQLPSYLLQPTSPAIDATSDNHTDIGCHEFYFNSGTAFSPLISTVYPRAYKTIAVTLFGDEDNQSPSMNAFVTEIEIAYELNGQTVTVSPSIIVTQNALQSFTWDLGPRAIGNRLTLKTLLKSFTFQSSLYVNDITINW